MTEAMVVSPAEMIALGDSRVDGRRDGSLDPTEENQWPSNRHQRRANLQFADGHAESALRRAVIDPAPGNPWRRRWNLDHQPHPEIHWAVNRAVEGKSER